MAIWKVKSRRKQVFGSEKAHNNMGAFNCAELHSNKAEFLEAHERSIERVGGRGGAGKKMRGDDNRTDSVEIIGIDGEKNSSGAWEGRAHVARDLSVWNKATNEKGAGSRRIFGSGGRRQKRGSLFPASISADRTNEVVKFQKENAPFERGT